MPDIFDQIHSEASGPAPAPVAGGDIFDQIHAQAARPQGDVFDQIHAQAAGQVPASPAAYFQQHPGMDPLAVQTAFQEQATGQTLQRGTTPEMVTRQQTAEQNAGRGVAGSAVAGALQNYSGAGGRIEKMLAGPVGLISPQAAANMRLAAERTEDFAPSEQHHLAGLAGNVVGGIPAGLAGPAGVALNTANAGEQAYHNVEQLRDQGQQISGGRAAADVIGQSLLAGGLTKLGQKNITGPLAPTIAKALVGEGKPAASAIARLLTKGAIGYGIGSGGQAAQNLVTKETVSPQQKVGEGTGTAGLVGAGTEAGGGAIHELLSRGRGRGAETPPQPAADDRGQRAKQTPPEEIAHGEVNRQIPVKAEPSPLLGGLKGKQASIEEGTYADRSMDETKPAPAAVPEKTLKDHADVIQKYTNGEIADRANIPQEHHEVLDIGKELTGRDVVPFRGKGAGSAGFYHDNTVYYNVNTPEADRVTTIAHEAAHWLQENHPDLIKPIADAIPAETRQGVLADYADQYRKAFGREVPQRYHDKEVEAEIIGHTFANPDVRDAVMREEPKGFAKVADVVVSKLRGLSARGRLTNQIIDSLREARARAVDQTARTSEQVQTERPQMFGARKGMVAVPDALNKLVQRDVAPKIEQTKGNLKTSFDAVNRFVGTGLNLGTKGRDTAISLRESEAEHEVHQARMETELKPYRDELEKLTPDERAQWVDAAEQHGMSGHPKLWGLEIQNREWNKANAEEGKEYGLNTDKWKADWIGRLATFPQGQEAGPGGKTRGSIAGSQKFRLARDYDTFSEFKKAVEDAGGKLKYENPADMLLAKQMEVRRSIEARKLMYEQEKAGQLTWRPDSEKSADEQHDTKLDDPLAKQTRDVVAPKWMVAKLLNMPHAEAEQYLKSKQWQNKSQMLRPGDELPQGYAKSGEQVSGAYHGDANVAGLFNNLISKGFEKSVPVLSQIANLRRRVTALNLAVPTAHAALTTVSNSVSQFGLAMEAAAKGHWDLAVKNAYRAINPAAAANFGGKLREQAANPQAHPELEPTVQTSMKGGNKFDLKSVLNETAYQKAKTEWEAGNKAGAVGRGLKAVYHTIEAPLFEKYIPNIKAAAKGAAAEIAVRDGLSGKELSRKMALAQDNVDNLLGMVKRSHQFQNRILTDLQDVVFTAPKFAEGTFRFAGAVGRDTFGALRDIASGKKPTMTPAMYSAAAGILTHMAGSALMQLAYTTATTGKAIWPSSLEDYYKPRTGRKDDAGRDERVSILSPFSALFSLGEHGVGSVTGRIAGLWKAAKAEMTGVDEQGRKLEGVSGRLGYAGKQALPYSIQNLMDMKKRGDVTPDKVAGSMLGMHFGHEGATPAERAAWDVIHAHYQAQPRGQEEADKSDAVQKLVHEQHTHDPKAAEDIQKALKDGVISTKDLSAIRRRAAEKPGLAGLLHSTEIDAKSLMSDVWPKMTPDERKQFRLVVRGKIGRSSLPYADKQELWKQTDVP